MMKTIGKYQIFAEIHRGPITTLYKAVHHQLERVVLIKQLNADWIKDKQLLDRFQQEGLIIAKINHPNVIGIFDYGIENEAPYLVIEFIEGVSLAELLEKKDILPLDIVIFIISQICSGLFALHRKNFIHRDIKPANILVSNEGDVKIGDFGFAESKLNSSGHIWGTPAYMSPEVVLSQKVDERSDIFSLGILFYELLSGKNPLNMKDKTKIFKKIVTIDLPSVKKFRSKIPDEIASIGDKMVMKEPQQRYASLKPIIRELEPFTKNVNKESLAKFLQHPETYIEQPIETTQPIIEHKKKTAYIYVPIIAAIAFIMLFWGIKNLNKQKVENSTLSKNKEKIPNTAQMLAEDTLNNLPDDQEKLNILPNHQVDSLDISKHSISDVEKNLEKADILSPLPISISSDPRAWIIINGDSVGIAPIRYEINSIPASLGIELKRPGFPLIKKEITINTSADTIFNLSLWQEIGYLNISVNPWGEIWIDGDSVDVTPLLQPLVLVPGRHQLKVHHPNRKKAEEAIFIVAGDTLHKSFNLIKK